jgi:hypothetical protein
MVLSGGAIVSDAGCRRGPALHRNATKHFVSYYGRDGGVGGSSFRRLVHDSTLHPWEEGRGMEGSGGVGTTEAVGEPIGGWAVWKFVGETRCLE